MQRSSVFGDLEALLEHADSKFSLVNIVTKRARQLNNWIRVQALPPTDRREYFTSEPLVDKDTINPNKPVSIALDEIAEGKIGYHRTREGIK
ncbi:MAG TPA: DNA-directed RNA polymerase subunit omega [Candidatus Tumulicola sp.]|nr:DNA-directed RNA polymerase subunit omega [Candidatus Tumulicola sp.]